MPPPSNIVALIGLNLLFVLSSCSSLGDTVVVTPKNSSKIESSALQSGNSNMPQITKSKEMTYTVPGGGTTTTQFMITFQKDIITNVFTEMIHGDHESREYQDRFARKISQIVGKKISEIDIHGIGGASLTTLAFETFIKNISGT